jgi:putative lipase involved disintegration of autophagic bodies
VIDFENSASTTLVTPTLSGVNFPSGAQIMTGVYTPWKSVHDIVISTVQSLIAKYPDYTLESTGHSLGGSLAYIAHIALTQNFPEKSVTSNAMAAFAIGNAEFAAFGAAQNGLLRRGNNEGDGIPVGQPCY